MEISVNLATMPASAAVATNVVTRDSGIPEHIQLAHIADPVLATMATVSASGVYVDLTNANAVAVYDANVTGTWNYIAGVSGTVSVPSGMRVIGITAHASVSGASLTINGGNSFPIISGCAIAISPAGNVIAPTIVFTNTDAYFIETLS